MTNWTALVAKLNKAERDVGEWREGLADAEKTLATARAEMAGALGMKGPANGSKHVASPAPLPRVVRAKKIRHTPHDYKRKARILGLLKDKGGFLTIDDVVSAEKCSRHLAGGALWSLALAGKLDRVSNGRYAAKAA